MKNIKNDPPELTWKNTVASAAESLLNYKEEPRLRKPGQNEKVPNVIHPFFWSPFMLIDPGYPPTSAANVETVGNTETNKSETDQDAKNNTSDKETPDKEKSDKETTADSSEADSQATTPDEKTDETNEKEEDSGVHPVITVKGNDSADTKPDSQEKMDDKKATEDKKGDKTEPETGTQDPATKEPVAKEPASPKNPAGSGNTPITDEDLDDADADADDFYRPKR